MRHYSGHYHGRGTCNEKSLSPKNNIQMERKTITRALVGDDAKAKHLPDNTRVQGDLYDPNQKMSKAKNRKGQILFLCAITAAVSFMAGRFTIICNDKKMLLLPQQVQEISESRAFTIRSPVKPQQAALHQVGEKGGAWTHGLPKLICKSMVST